MTYSCRVDPEAVTENNECSPEILAWKSNELEVLVEMNRFKELKSCIMESDLGREVQRREEREWRKKMEELVASLNRRDLVKMEDETERGLRTMMEEKQDLFDRGNNDEDDERNVYDRCCGRSSNISRSEALKMKGALSLSLG